MNSAECQTDLTLKPKDVIVPKILSGTGDFILQVQNEDTINEQLINKLQSAHRHTAEKSRYEHGGFGLQSILNMVPENLIYSNRTGSTPTAKLSIASGTLHVSTLGYKFRNHLRDIPCMKFFWIICCNNEC